MERREEATGIERPWWFFAHRLTRCQIRQMCREYPLAAHFTPTVAASPHPRGAPLDFAQTLKHVTDLATNPEASGPKAQRPSCHWQQQHVSYTTRHASPAAEGSPFPRGDDSCLPLEDACARALITHNKGVVEDAYPAHPRCDERPTVGSGTSLAPLFLLQGCAPSCLFLPRLPTGHSHYL